jgi:hypothetical protein
MIDDRRELPVRGIARGERNVGLVNIEKIARALRITLSDLLRGV